MKPSLLLSSSHSVNPMASDAEPPPADAPPRVRAHSEPPLLQEQQGRNGAISPVHFEPPLSPRAREKTSQLVAHLAEPKKKQRRRGSALFHLGAQGLMSTSGLAEKDDRQPWRIRLGEFLETPRVHKTILLLLLLDTCFVVLDLILEKRDCEGESHTRTEFEHALKIGSLVILGIFCAEVLLLLLSFGLRFFTHPGYVLDLFVVPVAIVLEVLLSEAGGLIILLRFWRVLRVAHQVYESIEHVEELKHAQRMAKDLRAEVTQRGGESILAALEHVPRDAAHLELKRAELLRALALVESELAKLQPAGLRDASESTEGFAPGSAPP